MSSEATLVLFYAVPLSLLWSFSMFVSSEFHLPETLIPSWVTYPLKTMIQCISTECFKIFSPEAPVTGLMTRVISLWYKFQETEDRKYTKWARSTLQCQKGGAKTNKQKNKQNPQWWGYVKGYRSQLKEEVKKESKLEQLEQGNLEILDYNSKENINIHP